MTATLISAAPAAAFDIEFDLDQKYAKDMKVEKPTPGRSFGDHVVSYLRILPPKGKSRVFPVFINTHNYLICPDGKRVNVNAVKQVSGDRRSGVKVLGFFFDQPGCDNPKFHLEPVLAEG